MEEQWLGSYFIALCRIYGWNYKDYWIFIAERGVNTRFIVFLIHIQGFAQFDKTI